MIRNLRFRPDSSLKIVPSSRTENKRQRLRRAETGHCSSVFRCCYRTKLRFPCESRYCRVLSVRRRPIHMARNTQSSRSWSLKIIASNREDNKRLRSKSASDQGMVESWAVAEFVGFPGGLDSMITREE